MSFYGGDFFGGYYYAYGPHSELSGPFFDGPFFNGGFFGEVEAEETTRARPSDDEGKKKRRAIYKPTGLPPIGRKTVQERIAETHEIARQVAPVEVDAKPVVQMSLAEIDAEIGALLRKKIRTEDEEIMLLVLLAIAA